MALNITLVGTDTAENASPVSIGPFTPTADSLLLLVVRSNVDSDDTPTLTSGSFAKLTHVANAGGSGRTTLWTFEPGASPSSNTLSLSYLSGNQSASLLEITGHDTSEPFGPGAPSNIATAGDSSPSGETTMNPAVSALSQSGNAFIGFVWVDTNYGSRSAEDANGPWTELYLGLMGSSPDLQGSAHWDIDGLAPDLKHGTFSGAVDALAIEVWTTGAATPAITSAPTTGARGETGVRIEGTDFPTAAGGSAGVTLAGEVVTVTDWDPDGDGTALIVTIPSTIPLQHGTVTGFVVTDSGGVASVASADVTLSPPSGWAAVDGGLAADADTTSASIFDVTTGLTDSYQIVHETTTSPGGYAVTVSADGTDALDLGGTDPGDVAADQTYDWYVIEADGTISATATRTWEFAAAEPEVPAPEPVGQILQRPYAYGRPLS